MSRYETDMVAAKLLVPAITPRIMDSKAPVVIIVAIILMGAITWGVWAVRMSGGIKPERAELLAEEAEKECVLHGFPPEECPRLVGENHRACLNAISGKEFDDEQGQEKAYMECMLEAWGEPPEDELEPESPPPTKRRATGNDAGDPDGAEEDD